MEREKYFLEQNISMQWIVTSILMEDGCMAILVTRIISMIKALRVNSWLMKYDLQIHRTNRQERKENMGE